MTSPVVVQGTPVVVQGAPVPQAQPSAPPPQDWAGKGEKQQTKCRDPIFALLLWGNVGAMIGVAVAYGSEAFNDVTNPGGEYNGYMWALLICGICALIISAIMYAVLMCIPGTLIKTSLIFVVVLSGVWAALAFVYGNIIGGVIGTIFFLISICYARAVWSRIPFATINLITSTTAIKHNLGVTVAAYFFVLLAFGWSFLWGISFFGVWDETQDCTTTNGVTTCDINYGFLFLMFLSYFFTQQVIQNTTHVVTCGTVGTWWFAPEESGCCAAGVRDSFIRAMTTSFGSICFGSLLVAIVQALRALANQAQAEGDAGILACIAECILACLASILEYFNKWAFVYVGLYGYGYLEAGKNVMTLFQNRGWEAIIADDLVGNTMFLVSVIVGGITGCVGLVIEATSNLFETEEMAGSSGAWAFLFGFIVGLILCSILMSVVASGVNAVIVLFAEAPAEFEQNYPELSAKMRETWDETFPGCLRAN